MMEIQLQICLGFIEAAFKFIHFLKHFMESILPLKFYVFRWKLAMEWCYISLLTTKKQACGIPLVSGCNLCSIAEELDIDHILSSCSFALSIWAYFAQIFGLSSCITIMIKPVIRPSLFLKPNPAPKKMK